MSGILGEPHESTGLSLPRRFLAPPPTPPLRLPPPPEPPFPNHFTEEVDPRLSPEVIEVTDEE